MFAYNSCVSSLRSALTFLNSSVTTLDTGVSDYPRLLTVLKTVRHYELIPQPTLATAEASLRSELAPSITRLLARADRQVDRVERRIETLKARSELQKGRLMAAKDGFGDGKGGFTGKKEKDRKRRLEGEAMLRARMLRRRREGLKYSVERLELEVMQKEKELRKRLE